MLSARATLLAVLLIPGAFLVGWLAFGGSDGIDTRYPVEGSVLVNGNPLQGMAGLVMFVPDQSKGNKTPVNAVGEIDQQGRYALSTRGKLGAPKGWYKAVVNPVPPGTGDRDAVKRPAIHPRYASEAMSPLQIEVVAEPSGGAYDLKTTKN